MNPLKTDFTEKQSKITISTVITVIGLVVLFAVSLLFALYKGFPVWVTTLASGLCITIIVTSLQKIDIFNKEKKVSTPYKIFLWVARIIVTILGFFYMVQGAGVDLGPWSFEDDLNEFNIGTVFAVTPVIAWFLAKFEMKWEKNCFNWKHFWFFLINIAVSILLSFFPGIFAFANINKDFILQVTIVLYCISLQSLTGPILNPVAKSYLRPQDGDKRAKNKRKFFILVGISFVVIFLTYQMTNKLSEFLFNFFRLSFLLHYLIIL